MIQVSQGENRHVDSLATLALSLDYCIPWLITIEVLQKPSI